MLCGYSSSTTSSSMADHADSISISSIHPDIILTHILTKINGQTIASAGCASAHLHALCTDEKLWTHICNSTWPSTDDPRVRDAISTFPSGHRSFFSYSYSKPNYRHRSRRPSQPNPNPHCPPPTTSHLISAVDLHYQDKLMLSKVELTYTADEQFLSSPFRVGVRNPKEVVPKPVKFGSDNSTCLLLDLEKHMTLSWIVIDPTRKRSANLASTKPVSVQRDPSTGNLQVQYAIAIAGAGDDVSGWSSEFINCSIDVTCECTERGELHVTEVRLEVQDMDGKRLSGKDSLVIMQNAVESERRNKGEREEERKRYEEYMGMERERNERNEKRERGAVVLWLTAAAATFLVALWARILFAI